MAVASSQSNDSMVMLMRSSPFYNTTKNNKRFRSFSTSFFLLPLLYSCFFFMFSSSSSELDASFPHQFDQYQQQQQLLRSRRQFTRYICGIPPFIFHSDWPCPMWGLCANHGFTTNLPCSNNQTCLERNPNTECVQGTCCTIPLVVTPPAMPGPTSPWPGPLTLTWPSTGVTQKAKSSAIGRIPSGRSLLLYSLLPILTSLLFISIFFPQPWSL